MSDDPYDIVPSLSRETLLALIEKQKADIEKLRAALKIVAGMANGEYIADEQIRAAAAALKETG